MAKLYFRHGTMSSGKSLNLLAVAHNYEQKGEKVVVLRPRLDERYGAPPRGRRCHRGSQDRLLYTQAARGQGHEVSECSE